MSIGRVPGDTGIQPTIVDAKGDLIVATAADSVARQAVGTNNQILTADSAQTNGIKWANGSAATLTTTGDILYASSANTPARLGIGSTSQVLTVSGGVPSWATPSSGAYTSIATGTLSGSSVTISSIPATYIDLVLQITGMYFANDNSYLQLRFNADSTANRHEVFGPSIASLNNSFDFTNTEISAGQDNGTTNSIIIATFPHYTNTTSFKFCVADAITNNATTTTNFNYGRYVGAYNQTGAISSLYLFPSGASTFSGGTYTLYGVK